ncbi:MAG: caspase family protein [Pseudonocardiaceae bacterium]
MTKKALCVGINDYGHRNAPEMGMEDMDLKGCVNDAHDWADLLVRRFEFSVADVTLITDADATKENMIKGLKDLLAGAQQGDVLVFTNSSHGFCIPDVSGDEEESEFEILGMHFKGRYDQAICPHDYPTLIIDDELRELFDSIEAELNQAFNSDEAGVGVNLTVISDSCFSGTITDFRTGPDSDSSKVKEVLLSGTSAHQLSGDAHEDGRNNGFMTCHAIKTIKAARSRLTYAELHERMLTSIKNSDTKYKVQEPQLEASEKNKQLYLFSNEFKKARRPSMPSRPKRVTTS